jgi:hypothetical protein
MKPSREFYGFAIVLFLVLSSLYIGLILQSSHYFSWLSTIPCFVPVLNLITIGFIGYGVIRSVPSREKTFVHQHPMLATSWFAFWAIFIFLLALTNDQREFEHIVLGVGVSFIAILIHGWTLLILAEKWQSEEQRKWIIIFCLAFTQAILFVYIFNAPTHW